MDLGSMVEDEALVRRLQSGDPGAFALLAQRWEAPVFQLAYRLLGRTDEAEDVRQLALLRMHTGLTNFDGRARVSTWVYRVVTNLCHDARRSRQSRQRGTRRVLVERMASEAVVDSHATSSDPDGEHVGRALLNLPGETRTIIVLRHYHDLTFVEIAKILELPETTVRSRATVGMKRLAETLGFLDPRKSGDQRGEPR